MILQLLYLLRNTMITDCFVFFKYSICVYVKVLTFIYISYKLGVPKYLSNTMHLNKEPKYIKSLPLSIPIIHYSSRRSIQYPLPSSTVRFRNP